MQLKETAAFCGGITHRGMVAAAVAFVDRQILARRVSSRDARRPLPELLESFPHHPREGRSSLAVSWEMSPEGAATACLWPYLKRMSRKAWRPVELRGPSETCFERVGALPKERD